MALCHICHTEVEEGKGICPSRDCYLAWIGLGKEGRRKVMRVEVPNWQTHLRYSQQYRPAKVTLPKLRFMGEK